MKFSAALFSVASLVACAVANPLVARTVAQVESDIATIAKQTGTLQAAIVAFPNTGGTLTQALTIHSDAQTLITTLNSATTDVKATTGVSETDGKAILSAVQGFEPNITGALSAIITKKAPFTALPVGGIPALVLQDLKQLNASTSAFEAALIAEAPADLVPQATAIKTTVDAAFAQAIAAYS